MAVAQSPEIPGTGLNGESRLQALLGSIADALVTVDERGAIESANPAAERLFGYGAKDLLGAAFAALLGDPYREEYTGHVRDFGAGRPVGVLGTAREVMGRRSDGSSFPIAIVR
jgi:PAS domain S-box-containing protein